jgi:tRNA(fMet)-specific endonuclease VapC
MKYLLDTNVVSEPIKAQPSGAVLAHIAEHASELAIAAISWQEMYFGLNLLPAGSRRERIRAYLEARVRPTLPILPFDSAAAEWQARQRARLSQIGRTPAYADSQIAAVAAVNGLILVTRNRDDFADFDGLAVENWFEPAAGAPSSENSEPARRKRQTAEMPPGNGQD